MNVIQLKPYQDARDLQAYRAQLIHANPFWFVQIMAEEWTTFLTEMSDKLPPKDSA